MKRETPFKLAGKATLKVTQRDTKNDKLLLNTLQGGNDLHRQLAKTVGNTKYTTNKTLKPMENTQQQIIRQRSEQQALAQEVAALDNFRVGVTREKTKVLIENIKLRRREKHLQALSAFKEDLEDYKENLYSVYASLESDLSQVLAIRQNQLNDYLSSLKVNYLLTRDKELLEEITKEASQYKQSIVQKIKQSQDDLQRINNERKGGVQSKCQYLQYQITQIAFVLQDEAKSIALKEKESIHTLQHNIYTSTKNNIANIDIKSNQMIASMFQRVQELKKQWKQVNQQKQIDIFLKETDANQLQWPGKRQSLYKQLVELQTVNSKRKLKLISNLAQQHPDTITKANIDKWNDHLKTINQNFNEQLDSIIKELTEQSQKSEVNNTKRLEQLRVKLNYIENRSTQQVDKLIQEKCLPNYKRNNQNARQLLKNVINYVEEADEKENGALQKLSQLLGDLGNKTDDFVKKWAASMQQYEVSKAKVLDEDDEVVEKLTSELNQLKQELKEALHHMKLQEVQKACFDKIDQLEKAYRKTHQKNKDLAAKRPEAIEKFMNLFQGKVAECFSLFDQSKKAQLIEKAKKQCQQIATKRYQEEEKKKQEEEAIAAEQIKKKGGKAPPPAKPKDPKKALAEMEERKKILMQEIGLRQLEQVKTGSGSTWLAFKSLTEICSQLYKKQDGLGDDNLQDEIKNYKGDSLVSQKALISAKQMAKQLQLLRNNFFLKLGEKKERVLDEAQMLDNNFLEQSLTQLDKRLRQHYPLKGKLQAQIGVVRSGQITNHKKQYEKHVRIVKQKMDLQTQKFNYLLQKCLQLIKKHNADQKSVKQDLSKGKVLSQYQGCHRKAHQNCKTFLRQTHELIKQLQRLSSIQVQAILTSNEDFLKHTKSLSDGGEFSTTQLEWYKTMMTQVNTQISQQKQKRGQRTKQVQQHIEKRSKELIEAFDKDYNISLQDLSAREGTGKKYGRPKRIAQQKLRFQMNKCEQAQINIDKQIQNILDICNKGSPIHPQKPNFGSWRQKLMALQSCIVRYARHIEAIVNPCKARVMPRVTYNQQTPDALLSPEEEEQDKKRIIQQLLNLGPLGEQKEDKIFMKFLEDIEKIIGDQARAIYVGDKAKYITGNDKLPDFLRLYIQNMRKNAEQFRQESVRNLRQSCGKLSAITGNIVGLYFHGLQSFYGGNQDASFSASKSALIKIIQLNEKQREKNLQQLRPNLANPKCQQELKDLDEKEKKRQSQVVIRLKQAKKNFEDNHFSNATKLLYSLLNNYEFLILYFDSIYLFQDFVKVSGDDVQEKVHLDAKRLLLMKQKGISIDANSERNIKKKWESVTCTLFDFGDKKVQLIVKPQQQAKQKDKKGGKKDSKANKQQQQVPVNLDQSKAIQTVKTWRQKTVFNNRDEVLNRFSKQYRNQLDDLTSYCEKGLKENQSFKLKWDNIAKTLYVS